MPEIIKEIASRIHELRELSGCSLEEAARHLGLSVEEYWRYETGACDIPASRLHDLAHFLNTDLTVLLTGEAPRMHIFSVTRKGRGVSVERRTQYQYLSLAANFIQRKADVFLVTVEPREAAAPTPPDGNAHPGQEFNYILEGRLRLVIHGNQLVLNEGDCVYFDSSFNHAMEALDGKPARFLALIL